MKMRGWSLGRLTVAVLASSLILVPRLGAQVPQQGVKVHGRWVIEVRNPDGSVHSRREFENALTPGGRLALVQLLSGNRATESWLIFASSGQPPCVFSTGAPGQCVIEEINGPVVSPPAFRTLTKTFTGDQLILQGSFVATNTGAIAEVRTGVYTRLRDDSGALQFDFTAAVLESSIAVQATQTVSIAVTFSFS